VFGVWALSSPEFAYANADVFQIDIPKSDAVEALNSLALQTKHPLLFDYKQVKGIEVNSLSGAYTLEEALSLLLNETGLEGSLTQRDVISISAITEQFNLKEDDMTSKGKKAFLSSVSAAMLSTIAATPAAAQTAETNNVDEVIATGIRASLQRSQDIKRDANGVVDAISAEDIGKFPDTNLAESLQRITGVSINRVNGEGSQITVRGFGAGFNLVTLNGRSMPTADIPLVGGDGSGTGGSSRAFDFSNVASEGVSGLEVYKTGRAALPSGGIGATVNIKTARPLDKAGLTATFGAKAIHDTSVDSGSSVTPELSGLVSWSNDEQNFGIGVFGSYQQRDSAAPASSSASWNILRASDFLDSSNGLVNDDTRITNAPSGDTLVAVPRDSRYHFSEFERERINGQLVLQFAPSDTLRLTADATYAESSDQERRHDASNWFNRPFGQVEFDSNPVVATTVFLQEDINGAKDFAFQQTLRKTRDKLESFGFNGEWDASDNLTVTLDAHTSKASVSPRAPGGQSEINVGMAMPVVVSQTLDWRGDIPIQSVTADDSINSDGNGVLDVNDISTQVANLRAVSQVNKVDEIDLRGDWDIDGNSVVTLGGTYRSQSNRTQNVGSRQILGNWGATNPGDVERYAPGALQEFCLPCKFNDFDINVTGPNLLGFRGDAGDIFAAVSPQYDDPFVTGQSDNTVEEDVLSLFAEFSTSFDIAGRDANLNVGLRYEDTDVTSTADITLPQNIVWEGNNDFALVQTAETQDFSQEASYDNWLPNVDLSVDLSEDIVARASYSKTIARTGFSNLFVNDSPNTPPGPIALSNTVTGSSGNAGLLPLESDNFDVSVEWYFDDTSFLSVGLFNKRVRNFVGVGQDTRSLFGLRDATSGAAGSRSGRALAILNDLGANLSDTNLFTLTALIDNRPSEAAARAEFEDNLDANGQVDGAYADDIENLFDVIADSNDPLFQFEVTGPVNNREAELRGIEVAGQHFFGDTGFGVAGSYTFVDGDVEFDVGADPSTDQFALTGLSDTANATLIYEKDAISARLSYNWRDSFLASTNRGGGFRNPTFIESFAQVDANVTYEVRDNLFLTVEGINLLGEDLRTYGRSERQLWFAQEFKPRYTFGARYKF